MKDNVIMINLDNEKVKRIAIYVFFIFFVLYAFLPLAKYNINHFLIYRYSILLYVFILIILMVKLNSIKEKFILMMPIIVIFPLYLKKNGFLDLSNDIISFILFFILTYFVYLIYKIFRYSKMN